MSPLLSQPSGYKNRLTRRVPSRTHRACPYPTLELLEERTVRAGVYPNDPGFAQQWELHNTGQTGGVYGADMDLPAAWSISTGSMNTVVAVLDSGVDYTDPGLYINIWLNQGEIPAAIRPGMSDTDGDGLIKFLDLNVPPTPPS